MSILEVQGLRVGYGGAPALLEISLAVGPRDLVAIVGPNGAGKSTLIHTIVGVLQADQGEIRLGGRLISHLPPYEICRQGIALVPEGRRLFVGMTVEENLEIGCYAPGARARRAEGLEGVYSIFPILRERRRQMAGTLSGGQQQMLAIGRALMARPRLLLLDEPSLGLAPMVVEQLFSVVARIHAEGVAVLLVEQNAAKALQIADRAYVLEQGRIVSEGISADLLRQPHIRQAYLGEGALGPRDTRGS